MQKYFDTVANRTGDAIVGANVAVTTQGALPALLYTDNAGTLLGSPLITDANGYFEFYAADGRYNITITKVGITPIVVNDVLIEDSASAISVSNAATNLLVSAAAASAAQAAAAAQAISSTIPFIETVYIQGKPANSAICTRVPMALVVVFPANLAGSLATATVAATAQTDFDVQKTDSTGTTSIGTIRFAIGATTGTFIAANSVTFGAGDILSIIAQASQDATLANIGITLSGTGLSNTASSGTVPATTPPPVTTPPTTTPPPTTNINPVGPMIDTTSPSGVMPFGDTTSSYTLTFSDEFNASVLDVTKWNDHIDYDVTSANADYALVGGALNMWALPANLGVDYERILTTGGGSTPMKKFAQTHGYFECECKMPVGKGFWPTFWLMNSDTPSTGSPEIDIVGCYTSDPTHYWANANNTPKSYFTDFYQNGQNFAGAAVEQVITPPDIFSTFHKYGVKWSPTGLAFFFDGVQTSSHSVAMNTAMYMLMSVQFHSWSPAGLTDATTAFGSSNSFVINYVRAWQLGATTPPVVAPPATPTKIVLTSGTSWTVPSNWNPINNTIECWGAGAGGESHNAGTKAGGGGGGAYSKIANWTGSGAIAYVLGAGGLGNTSGHDATVGGDTYFNGASLGASSCGAKGGGISPDWTGGLPGAAASGVGTVKFSGGHGGTTGTSGGATNTSGGGGGGAGQSGANGGNGSNGFSPVAANGAPGGTSHGTGGAGGVPVVAGITFRNPYQQPFAVDSIWNMPIGSGATYLPANLATTPAGGGTSWQGMPLLDFENICLTPTSPSTAVNYSSVGWGAGSRASATGGLLQNVCMPASYVIPDQDPYGGHGNNSASFLAADLRTIQQCQPFCRATASTAGTASLFFGTQDFYGQGELGSHGGSNLSSLGGSIRMGELRPSGSSNPYPFGPKHALKFTINMSRYGYKNATASNLFTYPATTADGYATNTSSPGYGTIGGPNVNNAYMVMGALLAIPASTNITTLGLTTEAGKQLAWTLQNYGGYIVDDTGGSDGYALDVESGVNGSKDTEFNADYGYPMRQGWAGGTLSPWNADIGILFHALSCVTNNTVNTKGGGGTPRVPLAAPLSGTWVSEAHFFNNAQTVFPINVPAHSVGDVLYTCFSADGDAVITPPTGSTWNLIALTTSGATSTDTQMATYTRVATLSEPASYTWTTNISTAGNGYMWDLKDVDPVSPVHTFSQNSGSGTTITGSAITTSITNTLLVYSAANHSAATAWAANSFWSQHNSVGSSSTMQAIGNTASLYDNVNVGNLVTTTTGGASGDKWAVQVIAFSPKNAGIGSPGTADPLGGGGGGGGYCDATASVASGSGGAGGLPGGGGGAGYLNTAGSFGNGGVGAGGQITITYTP